MVHACLKQIMGKASGSEVSSELFRVVMRAQQELQAQSRFLGFNPKQYLPAGYKLTDLDTAPTVLGLEEEQDSDEGILGRLKEQHIHLQQVQSHHRHHLAYNFLCLLCLLLSMALTGVSGLFLVDACVGSFLRKGTTNLFWGVVDIIMVGLFVVHTMLGIYTTPLLQWLIPTAGATPTPVLLVNILVLLTLSASLPLASHLLGLTSFDLMSHYSQTEFLSSKFVLRGYSSLYLICELYNLYCFWRDILFCSSYNAMLGRTRLELRQLRHEIRQEILHGCGGNANPIP